MGRRLGMFAYRLIVTSATLKICAPLPNSNCSIFNLSLPPFPLSFFFPPSLSLSSFLPLSLSLRYEEVNVTNFHRSWNNGLAFCAIINRHRPDLLDYDDCLGKDPLDNFETAFSTAEKELGVIRFLDPEGKRKGGQHVNNDTLFNRTKMLCSLD